MAQLSGLLRHEIMDFMFANPAMLDDLDFLYKSDTARKLMFFYQVKRFAFNWFQLIYFMAISDLFQIYIYSIPDYQ